MAKIRLDIDADSADDLRLTIQQLAAQFDPQDDERYAATYDDGEDPNPAATQDAEPGERPRRTRRTKAQIAADNARAAEAAKATLGSATPASGASQAATPGPNDSSPQPDAGAKVADGGTSDIFGEQVKAVLNGDQPPLASREDVKGRMEKYLANKGDAAGLRELMEKHGGAGSLTGIDASKYGAVVEAIDAVLAS